MIDVRCSICTWEITVNSQKDAADILLRHHTRRHNAHPRDAELRSSRRMEEIVRQYAPSDTFGKLAPPAMKPQHDGDKEG